MVNTGEYIGSKIGMTDSYDFPSILFLLCVLNQPNILHRNSVSDRETHGELSLPVRKSAQQSDCSKMWVHDIWRRDCRWGSFNII